MPDAFSGEDKTRWSDWVEHFDRVAAVNGWDAEKKLQWLVVRLTGRAATAYRRMPAETKESMEQLRATMKARFEPESRKEM